jgi:hypothetical protein
MSSFSDVFSNPNYIQGFTTITSGQPKGLLYVESPNDIGFWRYITERVCPGNYDIKAASKLKANGKRTLELEYPKLHKDYIVGVDSDMDYLCPSRSNNATELNKNLFILHTFSYAKESLQCSLESVEDIMERLVFDDVVDSDILSTLMDLSHVIYDALVVHLFRHNISPNNYHDGVLWPLLKMPSSATLVKRKNLTANDAALDALKAKLVDFINQNHISPDELDSFNAYVKEVNEKGLMPDTAYQFIKGHILHDNYVFPILKMYRDKLYNNEMAKICNECRGLGKEGEKEVRIGELDNFYKKTNVLETLLNNTLNYVNNPVYNKIEKKLREVNL